MTKTLCSFCCLLLFHALQSFTDGGIPITLQAGDSSKNVSITGRPDTLKIVLRFHLGATGLPPEGLHLTLSGPGNASQTQPRLLDSIPFPAGVRVRSKDSIRTVRIVLAPLTCLAGPEDFSISIAGQADPAFKVTINAPASAALLANKPPTVSIVQDTNYLIPRIKGGSAPELQVISPKLLLSGRAVASTQVSLLIPKFMADAAPSHPVLFRNAPISIPVDTFNKNGGCPVTLPVPLMIQQTLIDSPSHQQLFYVQQSGGQDAAAVVVIPATGSAAVTVKPAAKAATQADSLYRFTFACSSHQYLVLLDPDTTTSIIRIVQRVTKDTIAYTFQNVYDASNIATFLVANLKGMSQDCANYISFRISNEFKALGSKAQAIVATTGKSGVAPATKPVTSSIAPISLDNATTLIHPYYTKKDTIKVQPIDILLLRDSLPPGLPDNDTVRFVLDKYTFPSPKNALKPFALLSDQNSPFYLVPKKNWHEDTARKKYDVPVRLYLTNPPIDSIHYTDRLANIRLLGGDSSYHILRLTERGMVDTSYPFWVDLGTNFDLLDGVKLNNLYGGVYGFIKDVARIGGGPTNNLSFTGGVYEAKSISTGNSSDTGLIYRDGTSYFYDSAHGGYPYYRDTGTVKSNLSVTSVGIFFSPHLRLTNGPADGYGLHIFFSLYMEMLWQRVTSSYDYSTTGRAVTSYAANTASLDSLQFKESSKSADFRSHYLGIGLPLLLKTKIFSMYVNSVFGWTNQRFVAVADANWVNTKAYKPLPGYQQGYVVNTIGFQQPARGWNPFILQQFRLNEEKYGISFTGEIRSILLKDSKPVISISLSKKFDLSELFNMMVKPFTPGTPPQ